MSNDETISHARWARFRFSVVGSLLAAPPSRGDLRAAMEHLTRTTWVHPLTGAPVRLGFSTIERWYYAARGADQDPVRALRRKIRRDAGLQPSLGEAVREVLHAQHQEHRRWSMKLHYDNLAARVRRAPDLGRLPSYSTVRRYMRGKGLRRAKGRRAPATPGGEAAARRFETREVRSYEASYVGALYHTDFHEGSRAVLTARGTLEHPVLFGCLDDRSRLACHLQWYGSECARTHCHGLMQAFLKRGLPRGLMSDRGGAQMAAEGVEGLERLGVMHEPTLPYSPYQNAKQEAFWGSVEGRLLAMLEGVEPLTLDLLNEATQAWVELDYNREVHGETGETPLARWLGGPSVVREAPLPSVLEAAFRRTVHRRQRRSDGTLTIQGRRFEIPSCYAHLDRLGVRYASWDLGQVHLVDRRTDTELVRLLPQDKERNAEGTRRPREGPADSERGTPLPPGAGGMAPLLEEYLDAYRAQGLPAAYLPLADGDGEESREEEDPRDEEEHS
jgi:transposase InsO family protein